MRRLWGYLRRYRLRYALGAISLLTTASLAMAVPLLLKQAVDSLGEAAAPAVTRYVILILVVAALQAVARTLSRALIFNVGRDVEHDLRNDLFAHLLRLPVPYYQTQQTGDLMSRLVNDVTAVRMLLGPGFLNLVNTPLYYAYGVTIMLGLSPRLTLAALLPYPLLLLLVKYFTRRLMEGTLRVQEDLSDLSSRVQETLSGIHVVRAYATEEREAALFAAVNERFERHSIELAKVRGQLFPLMRVTAGLGTLMVLWIGGMELSARRLGVGDLIAFLGYLSLLAWPTMALGWMLSILQRGRAAMMRLERILETEPSIAEAVPPQPLPAVKGRIEFDQVGFFYPGTETTGRPALHQVSFRLEPGQMLGIVGRTGAGKTSLASLLARLFDVSSGRVLLDGRDIRLLPLAQLRGSIGYVPQDPFLFSLTIRENLRFGVDAGSEKDLAAAAAAAALDGDIAGFPDGLDTLVGERGLTLSGGQKQRLTLARALLADRPILVLDDALSSVDTRTEARILANLRAARRGRTTVVIAHRLSSVREADLILVLDGGEVVAAGTHESLARQGGIYADLLRRQSLEAELEALAG